MDGLDTPIHVQNWPQTVVVCVCVGYKIRHRAAERWGLNTVEVLNTNNRTTLGSVNNNKPNVGPGSPTLGQKKWLSLVTEPDSNCRLPACDASDRPAKLQTLIC